MLNPKTSYNRNSTKYEFLLGGKKMLAKDGKEYDIDILGELQESEIEIIQFLRPDGRRRKMSTRINDELFQLSKNMILSAEELSTGKLALYGRYIGEDVESEYMLLADNYGSENSPNKVLERVIRHIAKTHTQANSTSLSFNKDLTATQQVASPKSASHTSLNPDIMFNLRGRLQSR